MNDANSIGVINRNVFCFILPEFSYQVMTIAFLTIFILNQTLTYIYIYIYIGSWRFQTLHMLQFGIKCYSFLN